MSDPDRRTGRRVMTGTADHHLAHLDRSVPKSPRSPLKRKRSPKPNSNLRSTVRDSENLSDRRPNGKESTTSRSSHQHQTKLVSIDAVIFGLYEIKPWYSSPYMLDDLDQPQLANDLISTTSRQPNLVNVSQKRSTNNLVGMKRLGNGRFIKKKKSRARLPQSDASKLSELVHESDSLLASQNSLLKGSTSPSKRKPSERRFTQHERSESLSSLSSSAGSTHEDDLHQSLEHISASLHPSAPKPPTPQKSKVGSKARVSSKVPAASHLAGQSTTSNPIKLFVCDGCFQYLQSSDAYLKHKKLCQYQRPPGRKVYQRGARIIWEVDGAEAKLYCQCLSLFGKLFIDHKYIFFDVEGFYFYVLTEATTPVFDHVLGFFSKEKMSYDGYNLACIVTFPPYQKKGYGTLLIEFSYELDRHEAEEENRLVFGTPERPLSELGAKGYLAFWTAVLVRYFRRLFNESSEKPSGRPDQDDRSVTSWSRGSTSNPPSSPPVSIEMTLEEISRATQLRPEDAAFALFTSGFTRIRSQGAESSEVMVITPELVEQVAQETRTKRAVLDPQYVLLGSRGT